MRKKREIISDKINSIDTAFSIKKYIGKKIFSKSGTYIGKVRDVIMSDYHLLGILVESNIELFIDKKYFASDSDAIMLSIDPIFNLLHKKVIDSEGRKIGKVKAIERKTKTNNFQSLVVKKNIFKKPILIPFSDIDVMKKNILLKKSYGPKK